MQPQLHALGERFKDWIQEKMATDPEWRDGPTVVFSGVGQRDILYM